MATTQPHDVKDLAQAAEGVRRIEWADRQMPVLAAIRERFERDKPLDGYRVSACLHVTSETANLMRALKAGGASKGIVRSDEAAHKNWVRPLIHPDKLKKREASSSSER